MRREGVLLISNRNDNKKFNCVSVFSGHVVRELHPLLFKAQRMTFLIVQNRERERERERDTQNANGHFLFFLYIHRRWVRCLRCQKYLCLAREIFETAMTFRFCPLLLFSRESIILLLLLLYAVCRPDNTFTCSTVFSSYSEISAFVPGLPVWINDCIDW